MPKAIVQDVIPKRSIRQIPLPARQAKPSYRSASKKSLISDDSSASSEDPELLYRFKRSDNLDNDFSPKDFIKPSFFRRFGVWIVASIAIIALLLSAFSVFSSTIIVITPKQVRVPIDLSIKVTADSTKEDLLYKPLSFESQSEAVVASSGSEYVEKKASGRIVIYNNWGTSPQRLVRNTRFETPLGLIYRIDEPVVIPGQKKVNSKLEPGSLEVTVFADLPGVKYNIGLTDWTIPGFKDDPARHKGFYGRSKTAMTGGFSGVIKKVDPVTEAAAIAQIESAIMQKNIESAKNVTLENVFFENLSSSSFEELPREEMSSSSVKIVEKGSTVFAVFEERGIASFIAKKVMSDYDGSPVKISNIKDLEVTMVKRLSLSDSPDIEIKVKGSAVFTWIVDDNDLINDLLGVKKSELSNIMSRYPAIEKASARVGLLSLSSFPDNPDRIKVERKWSLYDENGSK